MVRSRVTDSAVAASEAAIACIIDRGTLRVSARDLAAAAGIPERTFFRWFTTKEHVLQPVFDWGSEEFARVLTAHDGPPLEAIDAAFAAILWGELEPRTRGIFPIAFADAQGRAVFLAAMQDGERHIRPALAELLGLEPDGVEARAAAAGVAAAVRLALERLVATGEDPRADFSALVRSQHAVVLAGSG